MATENFQIYQEVDPNSRITVTASRVTWADLDRNETAYVAYDKGADYFDGNFVHLLTLRLTTVINGTYVYGWALTNVLNSIRIIDNANGDALGLVTLGGATEDRIVLYELDGGTTYASTWANAVTDTNYYLKIVRDENVGTFGTLYCYIYSDVARTTLITTLSVTLHTSKKNFRYIHAVNSDNSNATPYPGSGYTEDLTLEGGEASVLPEVSQQSPTSITATAATGNGNITSLGNSAVTAHGHCWAITVNPTTGDNVVDNGAGSLGAFTSVVSGLTPGVRYYLRAYAENSYGTAYSNGISFISGSTSILIYGNIAIVQTKIQYIDTDGAERYIEGTLV